MREEEGKIYNLMLAQAHDHTGIFGMGAISEKELVADKTSIQYRLGWNGCLLHVRRKQVAFMQWIKDKTPEDKLDIYRKLVDETHILEINPNGSIELIDVNED